MNKSAFTRRSALAGMIAAGILRGFGSRVEAAATVTATVDTTNGKVRGTQSGGISRFLGVPYGEDTRAVRFRPATPPKPWVGVRDCVALGHQAPQMEDAIRAANAGVDYNSEFIKQVIAAGKEGKPSGNESEDCLVLNVYTPSTSAHRKRPVMVWLHGGGFAIGSAGEPQYDGGHLARRGDVVVVGINHRLNVLGYLYLGAQHEDFADSGNVGLLDIVLALQWVRDNIANFGGDPGNVTIFGESGGGSKVAVLMAMPPARGLFHKAIIQSGSGLKMTEKSAAVGYAERTLSNLGIAPADVHKLETLGYMAICAGALAAQTPGTGALSPVVDGRSLPSHPFTPTAPEVSRQVPLLIGTCKDEATLFLAGDPLFGKMSEPQARERATQRFGAKGSEGIDVFKRLRPNDAPTYWLTSLATANGAWNGSIVMSERKYALRAAPVYMYRLDWESPFYGGILKSPHGLDTALAFDNPETKPLMLGTGPEPVRLAAEMSQAWINFARSGDPSPRGARWPSYDPEKRATIIFNTTTHIVNDPDREARTFLSDT
jgi:para-nitrobenzyl esterase